MNDLQTSQTQERRRTVILRLRELQNTKPGAPTPEWLSGSNQWGTVLSQLAGEAADLIEAYEAEVASLEGMACAPLPAPYE